jgi:trk system potassium uptake protein TrkA
MQIIICGGGSVGSSIASQLLIEDNDITVIDDSPERIAHINETLDVKAHFGHAAHPGVLEEAGAANADMLIAVTHSDEVNMIACQIAHSLFGVPTKISRIRHQNYLDDKWNHLYRHDQLPIDFIISPEIEVAQAVLQRLHVPGAIETIPFCDAKIKMIAMRCSRACPMINLTLQQAQLRLNEYPMQIIGVDRSDEFLIYNEDTQLLEGDELYFVCETRFVKQIMGLLGHKEREARRVTIIGGGNIGFYLARHIEENEPEISAKIIEVDRKRAEYIAEHLGRTTVLNGSALSKEILQEANVASSETVIAVTNNDEVNILSSLLTRSFGDQRLVALISDSVTYAPLIASLGIDVAVNPKDITVSGILQHIRKGQITAVHSLCKGRAEIIEAEVLESSPVVGKAVIDLGFPSGVMIAAVMRDGQVRIPDENFLIRVEDHLIIVSLASEVKEVDKAFSARFEFF